MKKNIFIFLTLAIPLSILGYIKLFVPQEFVTVPNSSFQTFFLTPPKNARVLCVNDNFLSEIKDSKIFYKKDKTTNFESCSALYRPIFAVDTQLTIKSKKTVFYQSKNNDGMNQNFNLNNYLYKINNEFECKIKPNKKNKECKYKTYLTQGTMKQLLNEEKLPESLKNERKNLTKIIWAGDIDNDWRLDFVISYKTGKDTQKIVLYLSSPAEKYDFVKEVRKTQIKSKN